MHWKYTSFGIIKVPNSKPTMRNRKSLYKIQRVGRFDPPESRSPQHFHVHVITRCAFIHTSVPLSRCQLCICDGPLPQWGHLTLVGSSLHYCTKATVPLITALIFFPTRCHLHLLVLWEHHPVRFGHLDLQVHLWWDFPPEMSQGHSWDYTDLRAR